MADAAKRVLNINIGILGHVDSGKTSLARAISTHLSTAALDKHKHSKETGMTVDLGFSSFESKLPDHLKDLPYDTVQYTLVDCPGHASLIRTVIGGAHIIDMMLLVIDATKGIQTQTAECIVIGEILRKRLIVVLNKADKFPADKREEKIKKLKAKLARVFEKTKFGGKVPMVVTSACKTATKSVGQAAAESLAASSADTNKHDNLAAPTDADVTELVECLTTSVEVPQRNTAGPFLFSVDHCFRIGGHGTVMTGTVLQGSVAVGESVMLPMVGVDVSKKIKSMQRFHKSVNKVSQGDRVGICVSQLDPKSMERGIACAPGAVVRLTSAIVCCNKVRFFKGDVLTKAKFHVSIGHMTVMATATFFSYERFVVSSDEKKKQVPESEELTVPKAFDFTQDYLHYDRLYAEDAAHPNNSQFAVLQFERSVTCHPRSVLLGSRLDIDAQAQSQNASKCRIAFSGTVVQGLDFDDAEVRQSLHIYKPKQRVGSVFRVVDGNNVIGQGLFTKDSDMRPYIGKKITLEATGRVGRIEGSFGSSGKFKVYFADGIGVDFDDLKSKAAAGAKGKKKNNKVKLQSRLLFNFKKYVYASAQQKKQLVQERQPAKS